MRHAKLLSFVVVVAFVVGCNGTTNTPTQVSPQSEDGCDFDGLASCEQNGGGAACCADYNCPDVACNGGGSCPTSNYEQRTYDSSGSCYCHESWASTCTLATVECTHNCDGTTDCAFVNCVTGSPCGDGLC